jgi:hypothetical protein
MNLAALMVLVAMLAMESWDCLHSSELRALHLRFSTGVTIFELCSVAHVIAELAEIPPPSRPAKRTWASLVAWFRANWYSIAAFLPCVQLRDSHDRVVDGTREMCERGMLI